MSDSVGFGGGVSGQRDVQQDDGTLLVGRSRDAVVSHAFLQRCSQGRDHVNLPPRQQIGQLSQRHRIVLDEAVHDRRQRQLDVRRSLYFGSVFRDDFEKAGEAVVGMLLSADDLEAKRGILAKLR